MNKAQLRSVKSATFFALAFNGLVTLLHHYDKPDFFIWGFLGFGTFIFGVPICFIIIMWLMRLRFTVILGTSVFIHSMLVGLQSAPIISIDTPAYFYIWAAITAFCFGTIMKFSYPENGEDTDIREANVHQTEDRPANTLSTEATPKILAVNTETKLCPFCAEEVKALAIKCKHCKSDISHTLE